MLIHQASWIFMQGSGAAAVPVFRKAFACADDVETAVLEITAAGVYEALLNGRRVGRFILAPGWTEYAKRLQVQRYDVTDLIGAQNCLEVTVANGWMRRQNPPWAGTENPFADLPAMLIAALCIRHKDGREELILTDGSWTAAQSNVSRSGIFDGEDVDAGMELSDFRPAAVCSFDKDRLIPQAGPEVTEQETLFPCRIFRTPRGERVIDFGQNMTGYMAFEMTAHAGERLSLSTAEVLDPEGNFYTENYRSARSRLCYICREGRQAYKPRFTFFGFRYLRVDEAPADFDPACIRAVVLHSELRRTGWISSDDPMLNQLFSNVVWGQKSNFLDVPTDCPQRDERFGWTGDAQVFARTASLQFDVRAFFRKWLGDLFAAQREDGWVPEVVPTVPLQYRKGSAAWSDAVAIIPWQMYQTYGDASFLENAYDGMTAWVDYIGTVTDTPGLWTGGEQYGDWLGLDAHEGSYKGASDDDLVASAFYANSTRLVIEAGKVLGKDVSAYEALYRRILRAFMDRYQDHLETQTEKVLALHFHLADEPQKVADRLACQIRECGERLQTGFVGTPYLLHVLSEYGYSSLAWSLLLRREYPGWLYPVSKGATTMWEHWDGIRPDGSFWSSDMNSFNHYAYGAVADWVFGVACGIQPAAPGFEKVRIAPHPDDRVGRLSAVLDTVSGRICSSWAHIQGGVRYEIETPAESEIIVDGKLYSVPPGKYVFFV